METISFQSESLAMESPEFAIASRFMPAGAPPAAPVSVSRIMKCVYHISSSKILYFQTFRNPQYEYEHVQIEIEIRNHHIHIEILI